MAVLTPLERWISHVLHASKGFNLDQLHSYQMDSLRETLAYVRQHSRFYRKHLADVDISSIRTMRDIAQIPFTDSGMLAADFHDFLCVAPHAVSRMVTLTTSGTTGRPKRLAFTAEDQDRIVDFFHHGMMTVSRPKDRVVIFLPGTADGSVGDLLRKGLARFHCEGIIYGPITDYGHALKTLVEIKADCAVGIPVQLLALSRHQAMGYSGKDIRLRSVLLSTDYSARAIVEALVKTWGCEVYDHYGMTEMGLGGAVECSVRNGYHLREADLLFEIVNPATGEHVQDGEYGEVVFSTLTRQGMPLIRYRTGDRSRFLTEPCPCGSILRRMERISGRMNGAVTLKDGYSLSITELDEIIFIYPWISAYEAELSFRDGCDCLLLTICPVGTSPDVKLLVNALRECPGIGELIRCGRLRLDIRLGVVDYFTAGTAKRRILDVRPVANSGIRNA